MITKWQIKCRIRFEFLKCLSTKLIPLNCQSLNGLIPFYIYCSFSGIISYVDEQYSKSSKCVCLYSLFDSLAAYILIFGNKNSKISYAKLLMFTKIQYFYVYAHFAISFIFGFYELKIISANDA